MKEKTSSSPSAPSASTASRLPKPQLSGTSQVPEPAGARDADLPPDGARVGIEEGEPRAGALHPEGLSEDRGDARLPSGPPEDADGREARHVGPFPDGTAVRVERDDASPVCVGGEPDGSGRLRELSPDDDRGENHHAEDGRGREGPATRVSRYARRPPRAKVLERRLGRGVPLLRGLREEPRDEGVDPGRHVGPRGAEPRSRFPHVRERGSDGRVAAERDAARQHLEHRDPEGVEVAPAVQVVPERLLGREVLDRPDDGVHRGGARLVDLEPAGEAEVGELHRTVRGEEDVPRLHVAVDDAEAVEDGEPLEDLPGDPERLLERQGAFRETVLQRASRDVLHRQEDRLPRRVDVEDADEAGARRLPRDRDLPLHPRERGGARPVRAEDLQRDRLPQLAVERRVDDRRPADAADASPISKREASAVPGAKRRISCPSAPGTERESGLLRPGPVVQSPSAPRDSRPAARATASSTIRPPFPGTGDAPMLSGKRIAIIGSGTMGRALAGGLLRSGKVETGAARLHRADPPDRREALRRAGPHVHDRQRRGGPRGRHRRPLPEAEGRGEGVRRAEGEGGARRTRRLVVSIAAGVSTGGPRGGARRGDPGRPGDAEHPLLHRQGDDGRLEGGARHRRARGRRRSTSSRRWAGRWSSRRSTWTR